jgi:hypothetical protein
VGKESLYIGRPFHWGSDRKSNWSALGVVKRFLGLRKFFRKLSWTESRVSIFDDNLWRFLMTVPMCEYCNM